MMCHVLEDSEIPQHKQDEEQKQYSSVHFHMYNTVTVLKSLFTINFEDFYGNWLNFSGLPQGFYSFSECLIVPNVLTLQNENGNVHV